MTKYKIGDRVRGNKHDLYACELHIDGTVGTIVDIDMEAVELGVDPLIYTVRLPIVRRSGKTEMVDLWLGDAQLKPFKEGKK